MPPQSVVRQPRAWLALSGANINIVEFEANILRSSGQISTAEITMALDDPSNPGPAFWSQGGLIPASIVVTNGDAAQTSATVMQGYIEYATIDWGTRTVTAQMSDLARALIDQRSDASWTNTTTSQIVQQLAAQVGLNVVTDPGSMAGNTFNGQDYTFQSDMETSWDVIQTLAQQDGYIAYVIGNTLYYVDPGNVDGTTLTIIYTPPTTSQLAGGTGSDSFASAYAINGITGEAIGIEKLSTVHNFDLGQGVQSTVTSFNQEQNQPFIGSFGAGNYKITDRQPGKTQQQVQTMAAANARYASMHEYTLETQGPGDASVQPNMMVALEGTGTAFDMTYYIFEVVHRMSEDNGYEMEITAYNGPEGGIGYDPSDENISADDDAATPDGGGQL